MKNKWETISLGFAFFSMFFGAGNIIYPLAIGQMAGDKSYLAVLGFILTATIMPMVGVFAMILYRGDIKAFFSRLGDIPGLIVACFLIALLGPLGSTPRCIALSYSTLKMNGIMPPTAIFGALSCCLIYLTCLNRRFLLGFIGKVLTPLLLGTLTIIILSVLWQDASLIEKKDFQIALFYHGLTEGYYTMDLLAAFFFSSTLLKELKSRTQEIFQPAIIASLIGAFLLAIIYFGLSHFAAIHGNLGLLPKEQLLSSLVSRTFGYSGNIIVSLTISLACFTTAVALISAFCDFFHKEILKEKISYQLTLIGSLLLTWIVSTFEFSGITTILGPILDWVYPMLIALTLFNLLAKIRWMMEQKLKSKEQFF